MDPSWTELLELTLAGNVPGQCPVVWFLRRSFITKMKLGGRIWSHGFLSTLPSKMCGGWRKSMHSVGVFTEYILVKVCLTLVYCIKNTFRNSAAANECH